MSATSPAINKPSWGFMLSSRLRQLWRWPRLGVHIARGVLLTRTLGYSSDELRIAKFQADFLDLIGVDVLVRGQPTDDASLWACNHVSWVDALIVGSFPGCVAVAKAEISDWPVVGDLVRAGGTIFIKRGANQANTVRDQMAEQLATGRNVIVYPEATTTVGNQVSYVFPRLLSAATAADVPIQPVSIRYECAENGEDIAPYIDNMQFMPHLRRLLAEKQLRCTLEFLPPIDSAQPRDKLANQLRQSLSNSIGTVASAQQKKDINLRELIAFLKARHGI